MRIALAVKGAGLGAWLDDDFARCGHIMIVGDNNRFSSWPNPYRDDNEDQEMLLAERVIGENVDILITGSVTQQAQVKLENANVTIMLRKGGTVFDLVEEARSTIDN